MDGENSKHLGHSPLALQVYQQGIESELEQPGFELTPLQDTNIAGSVRLQVNILAETKCLFSLVVTLM